MQKNKTGFKDCHGEDIHFGDKLSHKNIDGKWQEWDVVFSDYWKKPIGDHPDEIYALSSSLFPESELINDKDK